MSRTRALLRRCDLRRQQGSDRSSPPQESCALPLDTWGCRGAGPVGWCVGKVTLLQRAVFSMQDGRAYVSDCLPINDRSPEMLVWGITDDTISL